MKLSTKLSILGIGLAISTSVQAQDWAGPYAGLSYGSAGFENTVDTFAVTATAKAPVIGAFAGYQTQSGSMVFGGELAYSYASYPPDGSIHISDTESRYLDIKGRAGYAIGNMMFYGTVGLSRVDFNYVAGATTVSTTGYLYGLGADYQLSETSTLGIEYVARHVKGDAPAFGAIITDTGGAVSLRYAYHF